MGNKGLRKTAGSFVDILREEEFWYILLTLYFFIRNVSYVYIKHGILLNSDASAEMILASHLNKAGGFLSKDWFYSSELRVLNTQIVYKLGLLFFPHNWQLARTFSVGLFLIILAAAGWYLMWAVGKKKKGFLAAAVLLCPFGQWYAWNVIYNSYYVPHIAISLVSVAMFLHIMKARKKMLRTVLIILSVVLAFIAGLGGMRQLMVCYIPLWIAVVILFASGFKDRKRTFMFLVSSGILAGSFAGFLVNEKILSGIYSFKDYTETIWMEFNLENIKIVSEQFVRQFGWIPYIKVLSFEGVVNFLSIVLFLAMVAAFIITWKKFKTLTEAERILLVYTTAATFFMLFLFAETWVYNESYWIPILPFIFFPLIFLLRGDDKALITAAEDLNGAEKNPDENEKDLKVNAKDLKVDTKERKLNAKELKVDTKDLKLNAKDLKAEEKGLKESDRERKGLIFSGAFMIMLVLAGISSGKHPLVLGVPGSEQIQRVSYWLGEQEEYTKGIAAFWSAPVVTELTDGKIEMWTVENYDHLEPSTWLQEKSHENLPDGKVFVLMPCGDAEANQYRKEELKDRVLYNDGAYIVYGFDNYMEYFAGGAELPPVSGDPGQN